MQVFVCEQSNLLIIIVREQNNLVILFRNYWGCSYFRHLFKPY